MKDVKKGDQKKKIDIVEPEPKKARHNGQIN